MKKVHIKALHWFYPRKRVTFILQANHSIRHDGVLKTTHCLSKNYNWESIQELIPEVLSAYH